LNHRERLETSLAGGNPDRPPVALWRHFPVDDQYPENLVKSTLDFQETFDFDLVKVSPASSYCLKDWGVDDEWQGNPEGSREYTHRVIETPQDWGDLSVLNPHQGYLGEMLEALQAIRNAVNPDTPVIQTIFSPLSQAKNLVGNDQLVVYLRRHPEALRIGLQTITETTARFVEAALETGIDGIFYAVQHAQYGLLSREEYEQFGREDDLSILERAESAWLNLLHLHGEQIMFDLFTDYPVQIWNWHDQETAPDLAEALSLVPGIVCGGLRQWETLVLGTPEQVTQEAQAAHEATGGVRFMLGTGCVTPITAARSNLLAARHARA
jgi:uroporphyrinogen decarboxylase